MKDLIDYLPPFWRNSEEMQLIQAAFQRETEAIWETWEDFVAQTVVQTATWGLAAWEKAFGLKIDRNASYIVRRARVLAKLAGVGVTTVEAVKNLAQSFTDGEVSIEEHPAEYYFTIYMTEMSGDLSDLKNALEEVKPAHLGVEYVMSWPLSPDIYVGGHFESWNKTVLPFEIAEIQTPVYCGGTYCEA